jgi:hypothetical protein
MTDSICWLTMIALTMSAAPHFAAASPSQGATALDATQEELRATSSVAGLAFTTSLDQLPRAPASARIRKGCERLVILPATDGGKEAAYLGWIVTGEAKIGGDGDTVVSFAGAVQPVNDGFNSGYCTVAQGNIGLFHNGQLKAIAYASPSSKLSIGRVVGLEGGGARVWNGTALSAPIADVADTDGGYRLELRAVASQETLCGGTVAVPNIYKMKIDEARVALTAKGWSPKPPADGASSPRSDRESGLVKRGLIETDSCSQGLAFCEFNYGIGKTSLAVTTVGDDPLPSVLNYSVQCDVGPKDAVK